MSRRESRSSLGGRQTSALEEFENFKKKYLLVNKHIAKLNSSLNVRIEELLSQIAALNIDNLRLRASEMSLARKLENEQDRTRRLYRETESASQLLVSQVNSMKVMFGLDKPAAQSILRDYNSSSRQKATRQPHPPPSCRIARAPEVEMITEASEDDNTPTKAASYRQSPSPTPSPATPLGRRRSTGSTPHSTPASNYFSPPSGGSAHSTTAQGRSSDEGRRSSAPMSMEITNGSSPLTPCHSVSVANQSALVSPSPAPNGRAEHVVVTSPFSDRGKEVETDEGHSTRNAVDVELASPFNIPQLNLTGLKRVARSRPSGLLTEEPSRGAHPSVSVSIPSTSTSGNGAPAYPTPLSAEPAPSTPPKISSIRLPGSTSPTTPTRTLPMSPSLSANPALSPPPARKLSLTRRQLDFGIPDPEETESDDFGTDINPAEPEADGLFGFQSDSVVGTRAMKRKGPEDDDRDDAIILLAANKPHGVRVRRQEKRRDTGTVLTGLSLREKDSREGLLKERGSKESLRDVTNEGASFSPVESKLLDAKDVALPVQKTHNGHPMTITSSGKSRFSSGTVAGIAAKLERLSSATRPKPLTTPTPLPLPSSDRDIKIPLAEEEQPDDAATAAEAAASELGRRNSGRQRKSVNYKEPSLNTKMRKPDPTPAPTASSSAPVSSSSSAGGNSAVITPTATTTIAPRPPKRKEGSISLIGEMSTGASGHLGSTSASSLYLATADADSRKSSKLDLLEPASGPVDVPRQQKRTSRLWEKYIDLSDEEDEKAGNGGRDSSTALQGEPGGGYFSSETGSRYSFAGLTGLRGTSILAKGPNPIIATNAPNPIVRSTASLRITPGAARERVRDELAGGAAARREREKEREREREREREQEGERGTNGIAI